MVAISFSDYEMAKKIIQRSKRATVRPLSQRLLNLLLRRQNLTLWYKQRTPGRVFLGKAQLSTLHIIEWRISPWVVDYGNEKEALRITKPLYPLLPKTYQIQEVYIAREPIPSADGTIPVYTPGLKKHYEVKDAFRLRPFHNAGNMARFCGFPDVVKMARWLAEKYEDGTLVRKGYARRPLPEFYLLIEWEDYERGNV